MRCPVNKVLVTIEKKFNDEVTTQSGLKLYQDTKFNPEQHVAVVGKVKSIPNRLGSQFENKGIVPEVQVGDEICFSYLVVFTGYVNNDEIRHYANLLEYGGEEYWMVDYAEIFCIIRDGKIIPVGAHTLVEPIQEDQGETFKNSIIIMPEMMRKKTPKDKGVLRHIGTPLTTQPKLAAEPGDTVHFREGFAAEYNIQNKKYYILKQEHLFAKG